MGSVQRATIGIVSAFVVGLLGTVLVGIHVAAGRSDTVGATLLAVTGVGAVCATIGTAARSRPEALLAGSVGLIVAVVQLQDGHSTAVGTAFIVMVLSLPYLAGFGAVALVAGLLPSGPQTDPVGTPGTGPQELRADGRCHSPTRRDRGGSAEAGAAV